MRRRLQISRYKRNMFKMILKLASYSSKWPYIGVGLFLISIASWKHFFEFIQWSQKISFKYLSRQRFQEDIHVFQVEKNCGVRHSCPENSFPIFLSTFTAADNQPRLCVSGNYVIKPKEKEEGRGLNAAVVDSSSFRVISVRNFDTYLYNKSSEIGVWIDRILDDDIIIIFTSDEASAKLSGETKELFTQLGSGKIQNLQYRSQWFMITQKGTPGFTIYEKITYSKRSTWGETIEFRGCVPKVIPKRITTADEPLKQNRKRAQFCDGKKEDRYKGFCNEPRFEMIMPALITNKSLLDNLAYTLPIFLFAGEDLEVFISCLDNMIHQPGVVINLLNVLYENKTPDVPSLANVYGVRSNKTKFEATFEGRLQQAREFSKTLYPKKKYLIVLDSGVIPSPDFLFFMAQIVPVLNKDDSVSTISGWSSNCYKHNGSLHLTYRISGVPKYGALISSESKNKDFYGEMYAPDVARVQGTEACHLPSLEPNNWIDRPQDLLKDRYFHKMVMLQQLGKVVEEEDILSNCSHFALENETNVVYLKMKNNSLPKLLQCLGVMNNQYGEYNGILRLFVEEKTILIISSNSSFYKSRPVASLLELAKEQMKTSTQIGVPPCMARTVSYEKKPMMKLPKIRVDKSYKVGFIYTPNENLKSTYKESFKIPIQDDNLIFINSKALRRHREYSKLGKMSKPMRFGATEYNSEYPLKPCLPCVQGISVEKQTTCPMVTTGRDERDPLPLTDNYNKYLDIYLSTSRLAHRRFTLHEQTTIAAKNNITSQETMEIPKGRGFGCRFRVFPGQDLDSRDKNMVDKVTFKVEPKLRFIPKGMPRIPHFGSESETKAAYAKPEGVAMPHLFDRFIDYPETIATPTAKQNLCPPGMYTTEMYAINHGTSPQTVV